MLIYCSCAGRHPSMLCLPLAIVEPTRHSKRTSVRNVHAVRTCLYTNVMHHSWNRSTSHSHAWSCITLQIDADTTRMRVSPAAYAVCSDERRRAICISNILDNLIRYFTQVGPFGSPCAVFGRAYRLGATVPNALQRGQTRSPSQAPWRLSPCITCPLRNTCTMQRC